MNVIKPLYWFIADKAYRSAWTLIPGVTNPYMENPMNSDLECFRLILISGGAEAVSRSSRRFA